MILHGIYRGNNPHIPTTLCAAVRDGDYTQLWFGTKVFIVPSADVVVVSAEKTDMLIIAPAYSDLELPPRKLAEFCDQKSVAWLEEHFGESGFEECEVMAFCLWRNWLSTATEGKQATQQNANALRTEACKQWAEAKKLGRELARPSNEGYS